MDRDEVEVHKNAEKELGQNPANTLAELNNCIGGLLHLGPNIITFRTVITLLQQPLGWLSEYKCHHSV